MLKHHRMLLTTILTLAAGQTLAGTAPNFTPLTSSAVVGTPNDANENNSPWITPANYQLSNLTSVREAEADASQSIVRVPGLGDNASMFDMSAIDPSGRYVFLPHETQFGAGVSRYDRQTDSVNVLFAGDQAGTSDDSTWGNDYGALDPATWSPHNTLLLGEEWSGQGRLFELSNPLDPLGSSFAPTHLDKIPSVAHEGLRFGGDDTLYFVDEYNSGSIYKFVPENAGDLSTGQTFVLSVEGFNGAADENWNSAANTGTTRTGAAQWVAITDVAGNATTTADPFFYTNDNNSQNGRGGRAAANEVGATPYGRPEDIELGTLASGNEVLYFTATSEAALYSVELNPNGIDATVRLMAQEGVTDKNVGFAATSGVLNSPDNLAQDPWGNIYIIEDAPNGDDVGGDVWFVRDLDGDGVAESLDHFMTLRVDGSESTGMIWDPTDPNSFMISVQHPNSMGIAGGMGDALWHVQRVPEPSTLALVALTGGLAVLARRR